MSRRCGSSEATPAPLTAWLWSQKNAKKRNIRKRRPYKKANHPSKPCCVRPVWGGETEKALRQNKPQKKVLWPDKPSSKPMGTRAVIQGISRAKNLPWTTGMAGGEMRKRRGRRLYVDAFICQLLGTREGETLVRRVTRQ